jgi:hypothetical protein
MSSEDRPAPARRPLSRGQWGMILLAFVVVAVVLVVAGLAFLATTKDTVSVSSIHLTSTDDACGVKGQILDGFTANEGDSVHESLKVFNGNLTSSCTIRSVTSETGGFTVVDANTPVIIPHLTPANLSFTIDTPRSSYAGSITLDLE